MFHEQPKHNARINKFDLWLYSFLGAIRQAEADKAAEVPIAELEAAHIAKLLQSYNGHRRNVADTLGISKHTLYRKLKRYNLD